MNLYPKRIDGLVLISCNTYPREKTGSMVLCICNFFLFFLLFMYQGLQGWDYVGLYGNGMHIVDQANKGNKK